MKKLFTPLALLLALLGSFSAYSLPQLSSHPSAAATIYLDFDGHDVNSAVWNSGTAFTCLPAGMSDLQVTEVFNRVAEDYRPFDINITTDESVFLAAPLTKRMRVIVTPTSAWYAGVGGVAYVGSFKWGDDSPCFVFSDRLGKSAKMVAECCSHESGHTVGLSHQSKYDDDCNLTAMYNDGNGSGQSAWAPIMGNSYYKNMSGWNNGPTPYGCGSVQDNLSIITSQNGFSYRTDDFSNSLATTPTEVIISDNAVPGIITTPTDRDAFKFRMNSNSILHLEVEPFSIGSNNNGANLDARLQIYNAAKDLIGVYDPKTTMNVIVDTTLEEGDYYMIVDGAGNDNTDNYGSLGSYRFKGYSSIVLPIRSVSLTGLTNNDKHNLNWNIITDDAIQSVVVEASTDGRTFTGIQTINTTALNLTINSIEKNDVFYRLKVTSVAGQIVYSNIIRLKNVTRSNNSFVISTLIHSDITINASDNFSYQLSDINGRIISKGSNRAGFTTININNQPNGMYVLQLVTNNEQQVKRIIKQ